MITMPLLIIGLIPGVFCLITYTKFDALHSWHQIHGEILLYPFLQEKYEAHKV